MSRTFPRPSSFKPERVVSSTVVWLTLRTSDRAWVNFYYTTRNAPGTPGFPPVSYVAANPRPSFYAQSEKLSFSNGSPCSPDTHHLEPRHRLQKKGGRWSTSRSARKPTSQ